MNVAVDLEESGARVCVTGYLSRQAGEKLSRLLRDLGEAAVSDIALDLSRCSPLCVRALERLLDCKFELGRTGVQLIFQASNPTLAKVFGIMGLTPTGEPADFAELAASASSLPGESL